MEEQSDEHVIDSRVVAGRVWAKRWWLLSCTLICTTGFMVASFLITPVYRVSTVLAPVTTDGSGMDSGLSSALGQLGGLAALAGISPGNRGNDTEEALAVMRSRQFTESFIAERQLIPQLFAAGGWKVGAMAPSPAKAYQRFDKKVRSLVQDKKTGLVTLQIEWTDREQAAVWANDLVSRLNAEMRSRAIEKSDASIKYLENELEKTSLVSVRDAVNRLIETQISKRMLADVNREYSFRTIDRAMAPDTDDFVRPQRLLMAIEGLLLGVVLGTVLALTRRVDPIRRGT